MRASLGVEGRLWLDLYHGRRKLPSTYGRWLVDNSMHPIDRAMQRLGRDEDVPGHELADVLRGLAAGQRAKEDREAGRASMMMLGDLLMASTRPVPATLLEYMARRLEGTLPGPRHRPRGAVEGPEAYLARRYFLDRVRRWQRIFQGRWKSGKKGFRRHAHRLNRLGIRGPMAPLEAAYLRVERESGIPIATLKRWEGRPEWRQVKQHRRTLLAHLNAPGAPELSVCRRRHNQPWPLAIRYIMGA